MGDGSSFALIRSSGVGALRYSMSGGPIRELSLKRFSAILVGIALILCIAFVAIFESLVRNSVVESYRVRVE